MYFDNILDEEFKTMLLPFVVVQRVFLLPKYKLYDNFIFFNSRRVDLMSLFGVIIPTVCYILRITVPQIPVWQPSEAYVNLAMMDGVTFCLGFSISYVSNLCYRKLNVGLVSNIHTIFKILKFNEHKSVAIFNAVSWFAFAALTFYMVSVLGVYINYSGALFLDCLILMFMLHYQINVIYACRIVSLIDSHLELWISEVDRLKIDKIGDAESDFSENSHLEQSTTEAIEDWSRLFKAYRRILETYNMFKKTFQLVILYSEGKCFLNSVCLVQYSIEMIFNEPNINFIYFTITVFMITLMSLVILIVLSFTCEHFYTTVENAQVVCLNVIKSKDFAGNAAQRCCKNALRLSRASFSKTDACGVHAVDATLPLRFVAVLVDYVVALLQFALARK